ncbi:MAG: hypothetical protein AABZ57_04265 [Candidatus Margulisiibacteriota bacterium]
MQILSKILFVVVMLIFLPIWLSLMVVYGMIIGPIGYAILFYQKFYEDYLLEKKLYKRYLVLKKVGRWEDERKDPDTGERKKNVPPASPRKAAFDVAVLTALMFVVMFLFGVIAGPIKAIILFCRRMYFIAFPDEILVRRKKNV